MDRILKEWITTSIGVILLAVGVTLFYVDKISFDQLMIFLPFVVTFFALKDKYLTGTGKKATVILLFLSLTSCITYERCAEKYGLSTDTITQVKTHIIPADSVEGIININALKAKEGLTNPKKPVQIHYITDPTSRAKIAYWYNKYNNSIGIRGICDTVILHDTIKIPVPVNTLKPPKPETSFADKALYGGLVLLFAFVVFKALTK